MNQQTPTAAPIDALLDGWSTSADAVPRGAAAVSFGIEETLEAPTYCVDLPEDATAAAALLAVREQALREQQKSLDAAEAELAVALSSEDASRGVGPGVAFGVESVEEDDSAGSQVQQILARLNELVATYARIETRSAGLLLGTTQVGWGGDFLTVWGPRTTPEKMQLHFYNVRLALRSRMSIVRLVSLVMTGATALAVKWCLPGGSLRMLPAAWCFVRDVLNEVRRLRQGAAN